MNVVKSKYSWNFRSHEKLIILLGLKLWTEIAKIAMIHNVNKIDFKNFANSLKSLIIQKSWQSKKIQTNSILIFHSNLYRILVRLDATCPRRGLDPFPLRWPSLSSQILCRPSGSYHEALHVAHCRIHRLVALLPIHRRLKLCHRQSFRLGGRIPAKYAILRQLGWYFPSIVTWKSAETWLLFAI